jgi:hypothetical protein
VCLRATIQPEAEIIESLSHRHVVQNLCTKSALHNSDVTKQTNKQRQSHCKEGELCLQFSTVRCWIGRYVNGSGPHRERCGISVKRLRNVRTILFHASL